MAYKFKVLNFIKIMYLKQIDSISSPRGYGATAVLEDSIYVIGGIAEGGYHHSVCHHVYV